MPKRWASTTTSTSPSAWIGCFRASKKSWRPSRRQPRSNQPSEPQRMTQQAGEKRGAGGFPRAVLLTLFLVTVCLSMIGFLARGEYQVPPIVGAEAGVIADHIVHGRGFASPYDGSAHPSPSTHLPPAYP